MSQAAQIFAIGDRVVIRPESILVADIAERDAIGVVEALGQTPNGEQTVDVRFTVDRLDTGLRASTLQHLADWGETVGHTNYGTPTASDRLADR